MASIAKTAAGTYRARWRTPDGRTTAKTFAKRGDAERHLTIIEHSKLSGSYVDPAAGRITFAEYAEQWRAMQVHRPASAVAVEVTLRRHVVPRLGHRPMAQIRHSEVQSLIRECAETLAPGTVRNVYVRVSAIFRAAVADRVIAVDPTAGVKLPPVHQSPLDILPTATVGQLVEDIDQRYRALIVLGAGCGLRISEALGLTVDRVDWPRRQVTIDRQLVGVDDGRPVFGPVKDRQNRPRTIPLPDAVLHELSAHLRQYGPGPDGLLFTGRHGEPIRVNRFSEVWRRAATPLGIPTGRGFHLLRHYYASLLIAHGESVKVVQDRLGDRSATITLDTYAGLWPDSEDGTRVAVDTVLGAALGGPASILRQSGSTG